LAEVVVHEQTLDPAIAVQFIATSSTSQTHTGAIHVYSPIAINQPEWRCYHRRMVTDHVLENMKEEMNTLLATMQYQLSQVKESKLTIEDPESNAGNKTSLHDPLSVWYSLENKTNGERASYSNLNSFI
jgi:hypothetical protein